MRSPSYLVSEAQPIQPVVAQQAIAVTPAITGFMVLVVPLMLVVGIQLRKRCNAYEKQILLLKQVALLEKIWHTSSNR